MRPSLVRTDRRALGPDLTVGPLAFGCWRLVAMSTAGRARGSAERGRFAAPGQSPVGRPSSAQATVPPFRLFTLR